VEPGAENRKHAIADQRTDAMSLVEKASGKLRLLHDLYRSKGAIRYMLRNANSEFIRFAPPGHYYSPIPDTKEIRSRWETLFDRSSKSVAGIRLNEEGQCALAEAFARYYSEMPFRDGQTRGMRYRLDNDFFRHGDGIILYSMLRHFTPRRVVEIGSGHSSAAMLDTNDRFLSKSVRFTFVEPFPDRLTALISGEDAKDVDIRRKPIQDLEPDAFLALERNDILFVDSSHVGKLGSDVLHVLFNVLPTLRAGVIVHFHDILWPFEYPENWVTEGRAWNEAYLLRAFLQYNSHFEILFFNSFMSLHHADILARFLPGMLGTTASQAAPGNTSLWIRRVR
jgi:hypothetical protein